MFHSLDAELLMRGLIFILCAILVKMLTTDFNLQQEIPTYDTFFIYQHTNGRMRRLF